MASDDSSGARPAGPVVLRIKLRYDDVDAMVQKFAPNVGKSGLFLPTKSIQPIGTEIKFELRIANDTAVLVGLGKVKAVRQPDPANPRAAFGMAIELMRVTREGREVIMRMLDRRKAMGLPDIAIPLPEDVDTARRMDVETQPKVDVAATVRDTTPRARDSGPVAPEQLLTAPRPGSGPIARAKGETIRPSAPALAPEAAKAKRPRLADLIAKANESSGAVAAVSVPGLDEHVDVARALTRARALAGGDLDTELAALRESAAAPVPIDIEAASAELAKQLGGAAIAKRDRSTRWAPPPAIETTATDAAADAAAAAVAATAASRAAEAAEQAAAAVPSADPVVEAAPVADADAGSESELEAVSESVDALRQRFTSAFASNDIDAPPQVADTLDEESRHEYRRPQTSSAEMDRLAAEQAIAIASREAGSITAVEPEPIPESAAEEIRTDPSQLIITPPAAQPALLIDDDADLSSFENALDAARIHTGVAQAAPPPEVPDDDDAVPLDSLDLELAEESTEIGEMPVAPDGFPHYTTTAATHDELAARLDQQLDAAEAEANSDFAIALQAAPQPAYDTVDASEDFADEEISDLDVLAEADADDADLLNADGERDASGSHESLAAPAAPAPPEYDFAAQLDLGDDDAPAAGDRSGAFYDRNLGELPASASKGHQLGEYDAGYDPPSSSYTFAESYPPVAPTFDDPQAFAGADDNFDEPHQFAQSDDPRQFGAQPQSFDGPHRLTPTDTFDEPHGFAAHDPRASSPIAPPPYRAAQVPSSPAKLHAPRERSRPEEDYDLEDALSTLDVDLDHLEVPDSPSQSNARPLPGMPPERAPGEVETVRPGSGSGRVSLPKDSRRSTSAALNAAKTTKPPRAKRAVTEDEGVLIDFDDEE